MYVLKHHNTFTHKNEIKELGGKWNAELKKWIMPDEESLIEAFARCTQEDSCNGLSGGDLSDYLSEVGDLQDKLTEELECLDYDGTNICDKLKSILKNLEEDEEGCSIDLDWYSKSSYD
jgi:hypothetical protein